MHRGGGLVGLVVLVLVILGTIYLYNRFSGKSIATLGAKAAAGSP